MIPQLVARLWTRTPLGWYQLLHNRRRLIVAVAGVAFANILIFMQLGFLGALFESSVIPIRLLDADVVLMSPEARGLANLGTIPRRRLYQALGVKGIKSGITFQFGTLSYRNPATHKLISAMVFAVDPNAHAFNDPQINAQLPTLKLIDTALFDQRTRGDFAATLAAMRRGERVRTEILGREVTFAGLFSVGASFENDGTLVMSDQTFLHVAPRRSLSAITAALLKVNLGTDPEQIAATLHLVLPPQDTQVITKAAWIRFIQDYLAKETPIGFVFTFGVTVGLFIGFVIVYQILFADVNDHLAEYATFKAMGYTDGFLLSVVFEEALLLAVLGFVPGFAITLGFYEITRLVTHLPIAMDAARIALVFALSFGMCAASGAIATRRLSAADPADIF